MSQRSAAILERWAHFPDYVVSGAPSAPSRSWAIPEMNLNIIATFELHALTPWLHVSFSHPRSTPHYEVLALVRGLWIGPEIQSLMVFPPSQDYVNLHQNCLHLYACMAEAGDGLPKFNDLADLYDAATSP